MRKIGRLRLFTPCFQVPGDMIRAHVEGFADLAQVVSRRGLRPEVLILESGCDPKVEAYLSEAECSYDFLSVRPLPLGLTNTETLRLGYEWLLSGADDDTAVGCCDADGEHHPLSFVPCLRWLVNGSCDGVVGSIIYPPHLVTNLSYRADLHLMQALGAEQAELMRLDGVLYIQSPGFQLHLSPFLAAALGRVPDYLGEFEKTFGSAPPWGLHLVMDVFLAVAGARLKAAYLPCFGPAPNRDTEKRWLQAETALRHLRLLRAVVGTRP